MDQDQSLLDRIAACRLCEEHLPHEPRPIVRFRSPARLVIVGQAPGSVVHESGIPWQSRSGDRLRDWLGLSDAEFYDTSKVAQVPIGFCYPGKSRNTDLPLRKECAPQWHPAIMARLPARHLILLAGSHAQ